MAESTVALEKTEPISTTPTPQVILESGDEEDETANKEVDTPDEGWRKRVSQPKPKIKRNPKLKGGDWKDSNNVVYMGHIPRGFEEDQIKQFFKQFGVVYHVALGRSKKTGGPRGYAHILFKDDEVAAIAAETMDGYFMLGKKIVCSLVPIEKQHRGMFGKSRTKFQVKDYAGENLEKMNGHLDDDALYKRTRGLVRREEKKRKALVAMGIDYEFPGTKSRMKMVERLRRTKASTIKNAEAKKLEGDATDPEVEKEDTEKKVDEGTEEKRPLTSNEDDVEAPLVSKKRKVNHSTPNDEPEEDKKSIVVEDKPDEEASELQKSSKKKKKKSKKRTIDEAEKDDNDDSSKQQIEAKVPVEKEKKHEKKKKSDKKVSSQEKTDTPELQKETVTPAPESNSSEPSDDVPAATKESVKKSKKKKKKTKRKD